MNIGNVELDYLIKVSFQSDKLAYFFKAICVTETQMLNNWKKPRFVLTLI